jgi:hypothetical protein
MLERSKNPPQHIVDKTCLNCELLPTKPGHEKVEPWLIAAANAANRVEVWTDAGITDTIYGGEISARVAAALEGVKRGRNLSQAARFKEKPTDTQQAASKNQQMLQSGEGVMDD